MMKLAWLVDKNATWDDEEKPDWRIEFTEPSRYQPSGSVKRIVYCEIEDD